MAARILTYKIGAPSSVEIDFIHEGEDLIPTNYLGADGEIVFVSQQKGGVKIVRGIILPFVDPETGKPTTMSVPMKEIANVPIGEKSVIPMLDNMDGSPARMIVNNLGSTSINLESN